MEIIISMFVGFFIGQYFMRDDIVMAAALDEPLKIDGKRYIVKLG